MTQVQVPNEIRLPLGTVEFITLTVNDELLGDLTGTATISIRPSGVLEHSWRAAGWLGDVGSTRQVQTSQVVDTATLNPGGDPSTYYGLFVRVGASPETPIVYAGELVVFD